MRAEARRRRGRGAGWRPRTRRRLLRPRRKGGGVGHGLGTLSQTDRRSSRTWSGAHRAHHQKRHRLGQVSHAYLFTARAARAASTTTGAFWPRRFCVREGPRPSPDGTRRLRDVR